MYKIIFLLCALFLGSLEAGRNQRPLDGSNDHSQTLWSTASRLIRKTCPAVTDSILQIGCGEGKISAMLALQVPKGKVVGIDSSNELLTIANSSFAPNSLNNLFFYKLDAQNLPFVNEFDIVYSFSSFHLLSNQQALYAGIKRSLKVNGRLVFNQPLGLPVLLQKSLDVTTKTDRWSNYFRTYYPDWFYTNVHQTFNYLDRVGFDIQRIEVLNHSDRFLNKQTFKNFLAQWLDYLDAIPAWEWNDFLDDLITKYVEFIPLNADGNVIYPQQFLEVEAIKR